jgi:DNA processing protein
MFEWLDEALSQHSPEFGMAASGSTTTLARMSPSWDDAERAILVALLRTRPQGWRWPEIAAEVAQTGSARELWSRLVPSDLFGQTPDDHPDVTAARSDIAAWREAPYRFLTFMDDAYPARLRDVLQMPPVLFAAGMLITDDIGICVVGSRTASQVSLGFTRQVAEGLVARSITVVSGLARGIDTAAHRSALKAGGRTVAVIGTGIEKAYPAENAVLQQEIERAGLVLSQFWPTAPPSKQSFPMRNAVMSAYGRATVVVEAGETSGARIQARMAVEHGRAVILTDTVVRSTTWGKTLVGRPGVHVARTAAEALSQIERLLEDEQEVGRWLALAEA